MERELVEPEASAPGAIPVAARIAPGADASGSWTAGAMENVVRPAEPTVWQRLERLATTVNNRLNPILVKEARQALKSRQFTITFTLVLTAAWGWTMLGVSIVGPEIHYGASGPNLFVGYFVILAAALMVVVPFSAFRSLAAEREDGTYELLSITTLKPRQVVIGKLASSVLQMIVYYSALAPCLAFTYLLRGIDIPTIAVALFYMFHASLGLAALGLLAATASSERHWQAVLSIFVIAGLIGAFFAACGIGAQLSFAGSSELGFNRPEFWIAHLAMLSVFWGYFALVFHAASAQLEFPSNNRSTKLRIVMLVQQLMLVGWVAFGIFESNAVEFVVVLLILSGLHWAVMGAFMVGETGELSQRVRRQLPQSFLGRAFFTWFNPGSGCGLLFTLGSYLAVTLLGASAEWIWRLASPGSLSRATQFWTNFNPLVYGLTILLYLTMYLGLARLIMLLLRRVGRTTMFLSLFVTILLLLFGCGVPLSIHLMSEMWRDSYSLIEVTNPFWTMLEMLDGNMPGSTQVAVVLLLAPPAAIVLLMNLPSIAREVQQVRAAAPRRVIEEDLALRPAPAPVRSNPWDDGPIASPAES